MTDRLLRGLKTENAIIRSTMLGYEDHGIFTCMLYLDREIGSQGFGGYALTGSKEGKETMRGYGLSFIREILDVVGVDTWEQLKGKHIRIAVTGEWNDSIKGIGNYLKPEWFYPKEFSEDWKKKHGED